MQKIKTVNNKFFDIISNFILSNKGENSKLINYKKPEELKEIIDFEIHKEGLNFEKIFKLITQYLEYSVNTGNHQFFNQLYGGFNLPAFMGEVVSAIANTSMATYEVAPVATLIETELIQKMCRITGFQNGDGIFVTGGSNANLIAMFSARNKLFPKIKSEGLCGIPKLSAFISKQAHYSFEHNANLLGIGTNNVYKIKSDNNGKMITKDLEKQINLSVSRGEKPFFIAATAATTLLAAFDPIDEIVKIGEKHKIWVHVDGSFGGSLILSTKTKHLYKDIEKVDSFAWCPHKLMNIPLVCSVILVREKERLYQNLTCLNDDYLFHETETGSLDLGKKSIQCGRRVDALKLWLSWKYYGNDGYIKRINNLLEMAEYFEQKIKSHTDIELLVPRQSVTVCFRFVPNSDKDIDEINYAIREELRKTGKSFVNFGFINGKFAFRWVVANADTTKDDIDIFFDNIENIILKMNN